VFLGITDIWTYVIGAFLITLLPGPNSLYVVSTAAKQGVRSGSRAAVGVLVGDTMLITLTVVGAPLLESASALFDVLKLAGAGYLAFIGLGMLHDAWMDWRRSAGNAGAAAQAAPRPEPSAAPPPVAAMSPDAAPAVEPAPTGNPTSTVRPDQGAEPAQGVGVAWWIALARAARERDPLVRALTISLLNPKMIMFYVSFFVQFVDPSSGTPAVSFLVLGVIIQTLSAIYLSLLILGGGYLAARFRRRRRLAAGLTSGVGALFVGFGLRLLTVGGG
jgi:leucine efflux protein